MIAAPTQEQRWKAAAGRATAAGVRAHFEARRLAAFARRSLMETTWAHAGMVGDALEKWSAFAAAAAASAARAPAAAPAAAASEAAASEAGRADRSDREAELALG